MGGDDATDFMELHDAVALCASGVGRDALGDADGEGQVERGPKGVGDVDRH